MASAQVVETSVANNSPSGDSSNPDGHFNQGILLLGSNHFRRIKELCQMSRFVLQVLLKVCHKGT